MQKTQNTHLWPWHAESRGKASVKLENITCTYSNANKDVILFVSKITVSGFIFIFSWQSLLLFVE